MANLIFVSNSISHFVEAYKGTPAWSFDSNKVPYSITAPSGLDLTAPFIKRGRGPALETWFHFRVAVESMDATAGYLNPIFTLDDHNGHQVFKISYGNLLNGFQFELLTDRTFRQTHANVLFTTHQPKTFDIKYAHVGGDTEVRVYYDEILLYSFRTPVNLFKVPAYAQLGGNRDHKFYYSEILIMDGDTRNARVNMLQSLRSGTLNQWKGSVTTLADDNPVTGMSADSGNQKQTLTLNTPYKGTETISNVGQITATARGNQSPDKLNHLVRMGGVDYRSREQFSIPYNKDYQVTDWTINPGTSLPWASSDFNKAEFGFESGES